MVGSPSKLEMMEQCQELLRSKSVAQQQQRLAAASHLIDSANFPYSVSANKCINNILLHQPSDSPRGASALLIGDEIQKLGRSRLERNDYSMNGAAVAGMLNPGSRQIYLTFPADSTFREEDVSNYFSNYGPVQDVRIPYQQKRMFGFVTFMYRETVNHILAKGNPHFVCNARVLVKPYKEKGKVPEKFRKQHMERGDFSSCSTPTGLDPYDRQIGERMFYNNTQELLWRRKLEEQAELQKAIELHSRRLMGLQLPDVKGHKHHRTLSTGAAISSPTHSQNFLNQTVILSSDSEVVRENCSFSAMATPKTVTPDQQLQQIANLREKEQSNLNQENGNNIKESDDFQESLEHNLPDSLFASPKADGDYVTPFSNDAEEAEKEKKAVVLPPSSVRTNLSTSPLLPASSTLDMASLKSCFFQATRFSSGHGAIGM